MKVRTIAFYAILYLLLCVCLLILLDRFRYVDWRLDYIGPKDNLLEDMIGLGSFESLPVLALVFLLSVTSWIRSGPMRAPGRKLILIATFVALAAIDIETDHVIGAGWMAR